MGREKLLAYAREHFGSEPEYLWAKHPTCCVLRHTASRKRYAAVMDVPGSKPGLPEDRVMEILNIKCEPRERGSSETAAAPTPA